VLEAISFLTPFGGARRPGPRTAEWFPLVGIGLGLILGVVWWSSERVWLSPVAAALVVGADLALTGMLHLDGVADAADGLLPHLSRERRLAVMREPTVGAFGVAVAGVALLGRWVALETTRPSILLLVGLWVASRTAMAVVATTVPYARATDGGLASAFLGSRRAGIVAAAYGVPAAVAAVVGFGPLAGSVALASGALAAALVVALAVRRVGGFTGDVLGAAGVALETVGLVVASARW